MLTIDICKAARDGNLEKVKESIRGGTDVNVRDLDGYTALILAARFGKTEIVEYLLEKGADANMACSNGNTPLLEALSYYTDKALVKLLIVTGKADVNLGNNVGRTPLHTAVSFIPLMRNKCLFYNLDEIKEQSKILVKDNIEIIEILLSNGANANVANNSGETPFDIAWEVNWSNTDIREGLLELEKVLIRAMLLQDPKVKKPKCLEKVSSEKQLLSYWDKQSKGINSLLDEEVIACKPVMENILAGISREGNSTLRSQAFFCFFQHYSSAKENNHSEVDKTAPTPSPVSR